MKEEIHQYLISEPRARERANKDRGLVNFLVNKGNYQSYPATKTELINFVHDFSNADRYWRMILSENPELQGKDYRDGKILADKKELELGYEPHYPQTSKQLKML